MLFRCLCWSWASTEARPPPSCCWRQSQAGDISSGQPDLEKC